MNGTPTAAHGVVLATALLVLAVSADAASSTDPAADTAPAGQWRFASYGPDEGLRNLVNRYIVQTKDGFIWVSSDDGLYRFEGSSFRRFGVEDGLPSSQIAYLHADGQGRLWTSTRKGLALVQGDDIEAVPSNHFPDKPVVAGADHNGTVWLATESALYVSSAGTRFEQVADLPAVSVTALFHNGERLWVGAGSRLLSFRGESGWQDRTGLLPGMDTGDAHFTAGQIDRIDEDDNGRLWIRTPYHWWHQRSDDMSFVDISNQLLSFSTNGYQATDSRGGVWAMTNAGITYAYQRRFRKIGRDALPTPWTWSLLEDHEGTIWLAGLGVHRLLGRRLWTSFTTEQGLPNDIVYPIKRDRSGTLWVGTDTGLARREGERFKEVEGTHAFAIRALESASDGTLWFGGDPATLVHRTVDGQVEQYARDAGIDAKRIMAIVLDESEDVLWLATDGAGLLKSTVTRPIEFRRVTIPGGRDNELMSDAVQDASGRLWVGSDQGLAVRDGDGMWRRFDREDGFRSTGVTILIVREDGRVCAAYFESLGLSCFRYRDGELIAWQHIDQNSGLPANRVYSLGEDAAGRLWVGTGAGAAVFGEDDHGKLQLLEPFGQSDGLPGDDLDARSFFAESDGTVWLGTSTGLARFDGAHYDGPPAPPTSRILRGEIDDEAVTADRLDLEPDRSRFRLQWMAMSYTNPARLQYSVQLGEERWRILDDPSTQYHNVEPGEYTLRVRSRYAQGAWGPADSIPVVIEPHFWETAWAFVVYVLLALLGVAGIVQWRLRAFRAHARELEQIISERTKALREANSALEDMSLTDPLTGLRNRRYVSTSIPADVAQLQRAYRDGKARSADYDLVVMMMDIDHFKLINDRYGHAAGDRILITVAERLLSTLRESDFAARWGGEEFLVVARHSTRLAADKLADRLVSVMRNEPFDIGEDQKIDCTCSVGFAILPLVVSAPESVGWEATVALSDYCLYVAKRQGRNRWVGVQAGDIDDATGLEQAIYHHPDRLVEEGVLQLLWEGQ